MTYERVGGMGSVKEKRKGMINSNGKEVMRGKRHAYEE